MTRSPAVYALALVAVAAVVGGVVWLRAPSPPAPTEPKPEPVSVKEPPSPDRPTPRREVELPAGVRIRFTDVTEQAGIRFVHFDGHTDMEYIMETMGSGVGWLDYDQDGLMDLFLVQGSTFVGPASSQPTCKLFKNLGGGRFKDVTAETGLAHVGCGQGVAVGNIDNDGYPDLFLTCYGKPNVLYHNVPDGKGGRRFADITASAGLGDHPDWHGRPNWSTSAAFLDYDNDGRLDLFVCSYVAVDLAHYPDCRSSRSGRRFSCQPSRFAPTRCLLYRNNGDGTFTDVSKQAGIDDPGAKALGVIALDLDDDGKIDIFVANDGMPNFLFRNLGGGRFESVGPASGCAVNLAGARQAYMGVDADDLTGGGRPDLFVTAFSQETNSLFRNEGGHFLDVTQGSGLGPPSWYMLAFGTCFLDADRDGRLDIAVVNGHVSRYIDLEGNPNVTFRQPAQFFLNTGGGRFADLSGQAGDYFRQPHVARGLACCDYDNDGHMDLAITNNGEPAVLLHNESQTPYHWLRLELRGTKSNRDAVGARVTVEAGGQRLVRHRKGGGSYLSASDPRLLIGLGPATKVDRVEVRWPSGLVQRLGPLDADRGYLVVEGDSNVKPRP
jgi:enediyne biosynthesis protein E4